MSTIFCVLLLGLFGHVLLVPSSTVSYGCSGCSCFYLTHDDGKPDTVTLAYMNVTLLGRMGWDWENRKSARYGGGYVGPAYGMVVHVTATNDTEDHMGCTMPLHMTLPQEPWIALIKRGGCDFEVKVENAFRSNAAGVVVYNDRKSSSLPKMKLSSDSGRNISAVFTCTWQGEDMVGLIKSFHKIYLNMTVALDSKPLTQNSFAYEYVNQEEWEEVSA